MAVWWDLTNSYEKKWKAKEKRRDTPIWMQSFKEQQGEIKKPSSVISVGEGNGTPLQYSYLENPMDGGAW